MKTSRLFFATKANICFWFIAAFLVLNTPNAEPFVPVGIFSTDRETDASINKSLSKFLLSLNERPLRAYHSELTIRFIQLPSISAPIFMRAEVNNGVGVITSKQTADNPPLRLASEQRTSMDRSEITRLIELVHRLPMDLPTVDDVKGYDGSSSVIEIVDSGNYRLLSRWCPRDNAPERRLNEFVELEKFFLDRVRSRAAGKKRIVVPVR